MDLKVDSLMLMFSPYQHIIRRYITYKIKMCLAFLKFQGTYKEEMPYFVMDDGKSCPAGSEIKTQDDCNQALERASDLGIILQSQKQLVVGSFPHVPYQCSYFASGDQAFHFNHITITGTSGVYV